MENLFDLVEGRKVQRAVDNAAKMLIKLKDQSVSETPSSHKQQTPSSRKQRKQRPEFPVQFPINCIPQSQLQTIHPLSQLGVNIKSKKLYRGRDTGKEVDTTYPRYAKAVEVVVDYADATADSHDLVALANYERFNNAVNAYSGSSTNSSFLNVLNFITEDEARPYLSEDLFRLCIAEGKMIDDVPRFQLDLSPRKKGQKSEPLLNFIKGGKDPLGEKVKGFIQPYFPTRFSQYDSSLICNLTCLDRQTRKSYYFVILFMIISLFIKF